MLDIKELQIFSKTLKILYVEDEKEIRESTLRILSNFFDDISVAIHGEDGLDIFKQNLKLDKNQHFNLIITDVTMPNMNGINMMKAIKEIKQDIPFIVISAYTETDYLLDSIALGVDGYIIKPIKAKQLIATLSKTLRIIKQECTLVKQSKELLTLNNDLESQIISRISEIYALNEDIKETQREVIFTMGTIGERRSKETGNHVKRVALYSKVLALHYGLSHNEIEMLVEASPMHDIGKVAIPDAILNKPGKLNKEEKEIMNTHTTLGYEMFKNSNKELMKIAGIISFEHHEKYDGSGYPNGLKGENISIYGRITALADVFDALGSSRVYKPAWEDERIFKMFKEQKGKHFDPKLIDIFFDNIDDFLEIRGNLQDSIE